MKSFIFLILIAVLGYKGWGYYQLQSVEPLHEQPYLVVYGRDGCGYTQSAIKELANAGIQFEYMSVDDRSVADSLHSRMRAMGMDTRSYLLPVVDLNNAISIRPDNQELVSSAKALALSN